MPHDLIVSMRDLQVFIAKLERYVQGSSFEGLQQDDLRTDAILHKFVQIAEALKRVELVSPETHQRVDRLRDITNFRNVIVHDYDQVDLRVVWDAATHDLPLLKQQIDAWAAELGMEAPLEPAS